MPLGGTNYISSDEYQLAFSQLNMSLYTQADMLRRFSTYNRGGRYILHLGKVCLSYNTGSFYMTFMSESELLYQDYWMYQIDDDRFMYQVESFYEFVFQSFTMIAVTNYMSGRSRAAFVRLVHTLLASNKLTIGLKVVYYTTPVPAGVNVLVLELNRVFGRKKIVLWLSAGVRGIPAGYDIIRLGGANVAFGFSLKELVKLRCLLSRATYMFDLNGYDDLLMKMETGGENMFRAKSDDSDDEPYYKDE